MFLTTATKRERRRDTFPSFSFSVLCRSCFSSARHIHHGRQGNCRCRSRQAADWRLARPIWEALRTHQCLLAEVMQFARGLRSSIFSFLEVEKRHSRKATTATREKKTHFSHPNFCVPSHVRPPSPSSTKLLFHNCNAALSSGPKEEGRFKIRNRRRQTILPRMYFISSRAVEFLFECWRRFSCPSLGCLSLLPAQPEKV